MSISGNFRFRKEIEWSIPDFFTLAEKEKWIESSRFFFGDFSASWYLEIYPRWKEEENFIAMYLNRDKALEYEVECSFGFKKSDLSVVHLGNAILEKGELHNKRNKLINKKELLDQKSVLVPGNTLTIICTVKFGTEMTPSIQNPALHETPSKLSRLDKLSSNFKDIFVDKDTCDVILKVKDKEFKAHRIVLMARSHVFSATFKHDTLERQTGIITISDCDPESFEKFLEYLYSGELEDLSFRSALNLYYTSNKYNIEELKVYCVDRLMQSLTVENVCEIALLADKHSETKLFSAVQDFFNVNSSHIFLDSDWKFLLKDDPNLVDKLLTGMAEMKLKNCTVFEP